MRVLNQMDRFDLAKEAVLSLPDAEKHAHIAQEMDAIISKQHQYIRDEGTDLPEVENWVWKNLK
jgi:xylulose-5-phosphate/fructose-6-phosphate phosphoketolase